LADGDDGKDDDGSLLVFMLDWPTTPIKVLKPPPPHASDKGFELQRSMKSVNGEEEGKDVSRN
jgi:hypothetical protein